MKKETTISRLNILQLVALGQISEKDVKLTKEEKKIVESNRKLHEQIKKKVEQLFGIVLLIK